MLSHKQLAEKFVEGDLQGRASNLILEGHIIYSYGLHWPLAYSSYTHRKDHVTIYFLNTETYSNSTSRHLSRVRNAIPRGYPIIEIPKTKILKELIQDDYNQRGWYNQQGETSYKPKYRDILKPCLTYHKAQSIELLAKARRCRSSYRASANVQRAKHHLEQAITIQNLITD